MPLRGTMKHENAAIATICMDKASVV